MTTELIQLTNDAKTMAFASVKVTHAGPIAARGTRIDVVIRPTPPNTEEVARKGQSGALRIQFGRLLVVLRSVLIRAPLDYVAVQVVKSKSVRLF
jgi:hypothetical protein